MRGLLVVLLACTAITVVTHSTGIRFYPGFVLDTSAVVDSRPLGYGEKVCTDPAGLDCWIEYHRG